jgi:23S rRNA (cytidine1920-2'-O)/16S rRNA (cytidine1409-2'-O)-methyltransferase
VDKAPRGKERLDLLLVHRGIAETREQARRLILAGKVNITGISNPKPGQQFSCDVTLSVATPEKYVSRGGLKLEAALANFNVDVRGKICADIGASTGGFTDCLLQHGAARVYAVDVGKSQMHERIRNDPRVLLVDNMNARELNRETFAEKPKLATVDLAFISLTKVLPALRHALDPSAQCIALVKPQFEAGRAEVSRGKGIIRDAAVHARILKDLWSQFAEMGWSGRSLMPSPILGRSGNREFLAHLVACPGRQKECQSADIDIDAIAREAS